MKGHRMPQYRVWLIIFAVVFLFGLVEIFGLRALIDIASRYPEMVNTLLPDLIRSSVLTLVDAVLVAATVIMAIRSSFARSTYQVWFMIIALGFVMHLGLGLITGVESVKFMIRYDFAHHKYDYYNLIGRGVITLTYGALASIAIIISRRIKRGLYIAQVG